MNWSIFSCECGQAWAYPFTAITHKSIDLNAFLY